MEKLRELPPEEQDLIAAFREPSKRRTAFATLVRQYSRPLYWQIRRIVINHSIADELVQETFLKAWRGLDAFRGESKIYTWLYRIAVFEALNYAGKAKKRSENVVEITEENRYLVENVSSDPYFDGDAAEVLFQKAIATLPPKQKQVFLLRYYEEKNYSEIAELTGTSEGALKASYHHAVAKIKHYIEVHH